MVPSTHAAPQHLQYQYISCKVNQDTPIWPPAKPCNLSSDGLFSLYWICIMRGIFMKISQIF